MAACLESVLHSYARRAQAGRVTVSQQKHLIRSASQRLPAVIVRLCSIATRPISLHSLPISIVVIPFSPPTRRSFGALPLLSLQIPFAARRLQSAHPALPLPCLAQAKSELPQPPTSNSYRLTGRPRAGHRSYCSLDDTAWPLLGLIYCPVLASCFPPCSIHLRPATIPHANSHNSCKPRIITRPANT